MKKFWQVGKFLFKFCKLFIICKNSLQNYQDDFYLGIKINIRNLQVLKEFLTFIHISWTNTGLFEVLILLYSLNVKNEPECSGWSLETWVFRFDVGALLVDLMVWPDSHILHFQRSEKTLFFPLMASYRWKNSDKWANFCLNFSSCSSSAKIHCKIISVNRYDFSNNTRTIKLLRIRNTIEPYNL